jgi:hypothetical protein
MQNRPLEDWLNLILITLTLLSAADQGQPNPVFAQVLDDLKKQTVGTTTLEALRSSDEFLHRVAHRIVRLSYQRQRHRVETDAPASQSAGSVPQSQPVDSNAPALSTRRAVVIVFSSGFLVFLIVMIARKQHRKKSQGLS